MTIMKPKLPTLLLKVPHEQILDILAQQGWQHILIPIDSRTTEMAQTFTLRNLINYYNSLDEKPRLWDFTYRGYLQDSDTDEIYRFHFMRIDTAADPKNEGRQLYSIESRIRIKPKRKSKSNSMHLC